MKRILAFVLASLLASTALAADAGYSITKIKDQALDDVALNAAAATRTVTATFGSDSYPSPFTKWRVNIFATRVAYTTITADFSCSIDGTNYAKLTSRSIAAGASTVSVVTDTHVTSASAEIMLDFDIQGCKSAKLLLGGAGAGASDLVDVDWVAVVGG